VGGNLIFECVLGKSDSCIQTVIEKVTKGRFTKGDILDGECAWIQASGNGWVFKWALDGGDGALFVRLTEKDEGRKGSERELWQDVCV
jgi:hypothetical protein